MESRMETITTRLMKRQLRYRPIATLFRRLLLLLLLFATSKPASKPANIIKRVFFPSPEYKPESLHSHSQHKRRLRGNSSDALYRSPDAHIKVDLFSLSRLKCMLDSLPQFELDRRLYASDLHAFVIELTL